MTDDLQRIAFQVKAGHHPSAARVKLGVDGRDLDANLFHRELGPLRFDEGPGFLVLRLEFRPRDASVLRGVN